MSGADEVQKLDLDYSEQIYLSKIKPKQLEQYLSAHPDFVSQINAVFFLPNDHCHGMSLLTKAASDGRPRHCEILCKNGADPSARDLHGRQPMDVAKDKVKPILRRAINGTLDMHVPRSPSARSFLSREFRESKPPLERKWSSGPVATGHDDDDLKELERTPSPPRHVPPSPVHIDVSSPRETFKVFDERPKFTDIRRKLERLQPKWDGMVVTMEMQMEYGNNRQEIRRLLADLKQCLEKEKKKLLSNDAYFQSMLDVRASRGFLCWVSMGVSYQLAWINCVSEDTNWNDNVDDLNNRWAKRFNLWEPQPIRDIVEIYPFVVVTQNRANCIMRRLAEETEALEGFHGSKPKRISRAWEKTAFKTDEKRMYSANIRDWSRGLITYNSLEEISYALEVFHGYDTSSIGCDAIEIVNVDCSFVRNEVGVKEIHNEERGRQWQDVKVHFRFVYQCPQLVCELQLCLALFTNARKSKISKNGGHKAYSKFRSVNEMELYVRAQRRDG